MSTINDGGRAENMSVRAWFAGQAIDAAMSLCIEAVKADSAGKELDERDVVDVAVAIADALIAKLEEVKP